MSIRLILGRAGSGKSNLIYKEIKQKLHSLSDSKLILLVPEQFTLQAERDLIENLNLPGIMRVEVLSFTRLAHKVFNEVGGIKKVILNDQGKQMVLRKILDELEKELTIFRKASKQQGFVVKFNELLSEFKKYDINSTDLRTKLGQAGESILIEKLHDIAIIYEKFNQYLEDQYIDAEDYINLLIEKMKDSIFLKETEIWIDGFNTFTPQTYRIIKELMLYSENLNITLTIDLEDKKSRDWEIFKFSQRTFSKFTQIAQQNDIELEIINLNEEVNTDLFLKKAPEIVHLEKELYAYPYKQYQNEIRNIEIFAGTNIYTEIENTAAKIISLVRDKGYRWKDIGVACNSLELYASPIKRILKEYNIPFFLDEKRPILNNPIVNLIISALEIIYKGYLYEDVFRYLKTGFCGLNKDQCEILENYCLQYGIRGNDWKDDFSKGVESYPIKDLNFIRNKFIEPLIVLEKKIKGKKTVAEITKVLYEFLESIQLHSQLENWVEILREQNEYEYVLENTQIWNIVMETFDQLVEILGEQKFNLKEYIRVLESGFQAIELGIIPTTIDQVFVGNIQRSKSHDIKALFVLGVNDGVLPSGKIEGGILLDNEKLNLLENGICLGANSEYQSIEEKLLIYSTFTKPSEYLYVSYAMANQEGKAQRSSILIERLKRIFKGIEIKSDVMNTIENQLQLIVSPDSTIKYLIENMRSSLDGKKIDDIWWDVNSWYYNQAEWYSRLQVLINGLFHKNQDNYIDTNYAKQLYKMPIRTSVSRLERFTNCPFSHFVRYGLRPQERKILKVSNPDIGDLLHNSLELFTNKLRDNQISWREINRNECDEIVEQVIDTIAPIYNNGILQSSHRYKYLVTRLKRISKRAIWVLTEHIKRGNFELLDHEISFGLNEKFPPIIIELSNGEQLILEGRIDRIDILENQEEVYVKVIDYKSGNKELSLSDIYYGLQLQLIVYLDAFLNNQDVKKRKIYPAGIFYFKFDDPLIKSEENILKVVETEIRKKLKMKGLVLNDVTIIRQLDNKIERYSEIIPVALTKEQQIDSRSSTIHIEAFYNLIQHVRTIMKDIANEIIKGNIKIYPCKKDQKVVCDYCLYNTICQFDNLIQDNSFRVIKNLKNEEVFEKIKNRDEGNKSGILDERSGSCHKI